MVIYFIQFIYDIHKRLVLTSKISFYVTPIYYSITQHENSKMILLVTLIFKGEKFQNISRQMYVWSKLLKANRPFSYCYGDE